MVDPDSTAEEEDDLDEADAKPMKETLQSTPDREAIDEPTTDSEQQARESAWMVREFTSLIVVVLFGLFLLALVLMQATGLVDFLAPLADTQLGQWAAVAALVVGVVALFLWSRRGV